MFTWDAIIIGGGAAGYFTAINIKEQNPDLSVLILEKSSAVLGKVKVSGGGRCNVTNATFTPRELTKHYPRGEKELLGPFHTFMTGDMMAWLSEHGVDTHIEDDNRVFPSSNSSQTIIDCFVNTASDLGVKVNLQEGMRSISKPKDIWEIVTEQNKYFTQSVVLASGSSKQVWQHLSSIGINIEHPVPSLFTFNISDDRIKGLMGVSVPIAEVKVLGTNLKDSGPLLITHWGLSGPAVLKLSAWGARILSDKHYQFEIEINWVLDAFDQVLDQLKAMRQHSPKRKIISTSQFELPKRLWESLVVYLSISDLSWAQLSNQQLMALAGELTRGKYKVEGKSTFKDEFVTAGGVNLKEIDFKTMQCKQQEGLYVVGEALNIDAITGGFNFQAAWTTSFIAAKAISA